ncbi:DUF6787 family protein [Reichenbachiella agariperforans]|uniref:DUF6787 domain-containing protein n=1 Tax=Reichenbachiella agariperforans TaxID=156994 RepID=A0A1M6KKZ7_REIAG|nr:DUF6787 family protein [Reichenbachiella agariperforans]MBU2913596.1 prolipoprotein diacylglyceryl transferase [Reichenbachiella agariperforans]SHJ59599.1 hypothetical protein SAMN04488028_101616 [Reichenbachiella agariperforans]
MGFLDKLQARWKLKNAWQVVVVLLVFACTGFSVMFLRKPIMGMITSSDQYEFLFTILYYIFILPVYLGILLFYGFLFGQFAFFWGFVKRTWYRMTRQKSKLDAK